MVDLSAYSVNICFICETFFNENHSSLSLEGYSIVKRNRQNRRGGGVAIIVDSRHAIKVIDDDDHEFEILWAEVMYFNSLFICGVLYHPPNFSYSTTDLLNKLENDINTFMERYVNCYIILAGDFNGLDFGDVSDSTGLISINELPTRGENVLDNVFSTFNFWSSCRVIESCVKTDHKGILLTSNLSSFQIAAKKRRVCTYRPHGLSLVGKYLANVTENDFLYKCESLDETNFNKACDDFIAKCKFVLDKFFPLKSITLTSSDPPFITMGIKAALRKRNKLMRKGKLQEAENLTAQVRNMIIKNSTTTLSGVNTRSTPRDAWKKVNKIIKNKRDSIVESATNITANVLNDHYAKISTMHGYTTPAFKTTVARFSDQNHRFLSEYEVLLCLTHIRRTSTGPDELPYWFIQISAGLIVHHLCNLYNDSIFIACFPNCFKEAWITPIPKIKRPTVSGDFRPISVTCIFSRIFDKLIAKNFICPAIAKTNNLQSFQDQFGFRYTGSCENALIAILDQATKLLTWNNYVNLVAIDVSKAFDCVSHLRVLESLIDMGIDDHIFNWIKSYLSDRCHRTKYQHVISDVRGINSGVIQGSGLGPLLFICSFMSLRCKYAENTLIKYADDCYLLVPESQQHTLTIEINHLTNWFSQRNLSINSTKCNIMVLRTNRKSLRVNVDQSQNSGFQVVDKMCILGVEMNNKFDFSNHVSNIVRKCNKMFYCLRVLMEYGTPIMTIRDVFYASIISYITYACQAWIGYCKGSDKERLFKIIKRGARRGYINPETVNIEEIINRRGEKLFHEIRSNSLHVLHSYLPPSKTSNYNLRPRKHDLELIDICYPHDTRNFLIRKLYE